MTFQVLDSPPFFWHCTFLSPPPPSPPSPLGTSLLVQGLPSSPLLLAVLCPDTRLLSQMTYCLSSPSSPFCTLLQRSLTEIFKAILPRRILFACNLLTRPLLFLLFKWAVKNWLFAIRPHQDPQLLLGCSLSLLPSPKICPA